MLRSLVGSEMCIRDSALGAPVGLDGAEQVDSSGAAVVFPAAAPAPALPRAPTEGGCPSILIVSVLTSGRVDCVIVDC